VRALLSASLALLCSVVVSACSSSSPPKGEPAPGRVESPIINGNADTTHQAVVFVYAQQGQTGGACSGTIVKVDAANKIAWVLTAAHCVDIPPVLVIQGNDYEASSAIRYSVLDYAPDPQYSGTASGHDFAVVRIVGADAQTPIIPITSSPDGLSTGTTVLSVGYGRTTPSNQTPDNNSVRRSITKSIGALDTDEIGYNQQTSGICQGDSGGPVIYNPGSGERVVGVHSYVNGPCVPGSGFSQRVTSGLSFINGRLNQAAPAPSCDLCMKTAESGAQACAVKQRQCFADSACRGYYDCLSNCTTTACRTQCQTRFPVGEGPLLAVVNCSCQQCATPCAGNSACFNSPKCGYTVAGTQCRTCTETSCCTETQACAENGQCYVCMKGGDKDGFCASNPQRQAMLACQRTNCGNKCFSADGGVLGPGEEPPPEETPGADGGGGGGPGPAAQPTTITTTEGCAASPIAPSDPGRGSLAALVALGLGLVARRRRARRARCAGCAR
jgi:hypothetical protein